MNPDQKPVEVAPSEADKIIAIIRELAGGEKAATVAALVRVHVSAATSALEQRVRELEAEVGRLTDSISWSEAKAHEDNANLRVQLSASEAARKELVEVLKLVRLRINFHEHPGSIKRELIIAEIDAAIRNHRSTQKEAP